VARWEDKKVAVELAEVELPVVAWAVAKVACMAVAQEVVDLEEREDKKVAA